MKPSDHPKSCAVCHGDGWMDGPPIPTQANGIQFTYATVTPCTHHWHDDQQRFELDDDDQFF